MKIINRYILREILVFFCISLVGLCIVLLTLRMLKLASLVINRGVALEQIGMVFLSIVPGFLELALPLSVLLATMLAFSRLSGDSELIVARATGIGLGRCIIPVSIFAAVVASIGLVISIYLRPWGNASLAHSLFEVARSRSTAGLDPGVFNKIGDLTLYATEIDYASGGLTNVLVDDRRNTAERKVIVAQRGRIASDEAARSLTLLLADGTAHERIRGEFLITDFTSNSVNLDTGQLFKEDEAGAKVVARELQNDPLRVYINDLKGLLRSTDKQFEYHGNTLTRADAEKKFRKAKVELGSRFSLPLASIIMAFIGFALGVLPPRTQRAWGAGISAALGLAVFVAYYGIYLSGLALAEGGRLKIWIALWAPNLIGAAFALFALYKICTEQWQSVGEGLRRIPSYFKRRSA